MKNPRSLPFFLERQLTGYTLAASAAGVGLLAAAQPAEAKIIYTRAHTVLRSDLAIDLNHDGVKDFRFVFTSCGWHSAGVPPDGCEQGLYISAYGDNAIWQVHTNAGDSGWGAAALFSGISVHAGPKRRFADKHLAMVQWIPGLSTGSVWLGQWLNVAHRYLGLKFYIGKEAHYGWARLNAKEFEAVLTGYAYETIPGKAIITGKTKGRDVITVQDGSLGHLARGAAVRAGR